MGSDPVEQLTQLGFSEYESKAYVALLKKSPVTGYELSKLSGVPRSMIYEVLAKLTGRGAAMTLRKDASTMYAPTPAEDLLEHLRRQHEKLVGSLTDGLAAVQAESDLDYVWNIVGSENVMAKAREMISRAASSVYVALLPVTYDMLRRVLTGAVARGVAVAVYTPDELDLPGGRVMVAPMSEAALSQAAGLALILVVDGEEVLIGEWLSADQARASWTRSPLFVFVAQHHLRTDLYLPRVLALLGDRAREVIHEEDWELFARALESHIG